jgi:hypothetical protein
LHVAEWTYRQTDRQTDGEIMRHISCIFLTITHQKLCKPQDRKARTEDNDIENIYRAMHKNT